MLKPIEIETKLKEKVFGQDSYVRELSVIGSLHVQKNAMSKDGSEAINTNTLVIGPSGSGKTHALKELAKVLDIPFHEVDGSTIQENKYRGVRHCDDILREAIKAFGKEKAEESIIFIDEFDKILDLYMQKEGRGFHVQKDFLKLFEPNVIKLVTDERSSFSKDTIDFDTSGITWICAGSFFETLNDGSRQSLNLPTSMGFNEVKRKEVLYRELDGEDLIKGGFMPELIGRFSNIINLRALDKEDLKNILKNDGAQIKGYKELLTRQGVDLVFTEKFYDYLSENTDMGRMGVRATYKKISPLISQAYYDVLNNDKIRKVIIDADDNGARCKYKYSNKPIAREILNPKKEESPKVNYEELVEKFMYIFRIDSKLEKYQDNFKRIHIKHLYDIANAIGKNDKERQLLRNQILYSLDYSRGSYRRAKTGSYHYDKARLSTGLNYMTLSLSRCGKQSLLNVYDDEYLELYPEIKDLIDEVGKSVNLQDFINVFKKINSEISEYYKDMADSYENNKAKRRRLEDSDN